MFSKFFAQDNATAKLSSSLVLIASILTVVAQSIPSAELRNAILIGIGIIGVAARFFGANKAVTRSGLLLLAYGVVNYLTTAHGLEGSVWLLTIAGVLKILAENTTPTAPAAPAVPAAPAAPTTDQPAQ